MLRPGTLMEKYDQYEEENKGGRTASDDDDDDETQIKER